MTPALSGERPTVAFFLVPDHFVLLLEVIRALDSNGYRCIVFCELESTRRDLESGPYKDAISEIISFSSPGTYEFRQLSADGKTETMARTIAWENRLGINFAHFLLGRRDISNAFALTGTRHPIARIRRNGQLDQAQILSYFNDDLDLFERIFRDQKVGFVVNPYFHLFYLAAEMDIGTAMLNVGRHESSYFWARSYLCLNDGLEAAYRALGNVDTGARKERSYANDYLPRLQFFAERSVLSLIPKLATEAKNSLIRKFTGSKNGYTLASMAAYRWRELAAKKEMNRAPYLTLSEIGDGRFVFFPLSTDPEWTLQIQSYSYFSQLWALAEVARDLPAGVTILVKEHIYAVGRRPRDLYDQILRFPNVRLLRLSENAMEVIQRCHAVVSINSTAGYEAAMMGKPSIILAEHSDYAFLPHVLHCPRGEGLKQALRTVMDFPMSEADMVAAGSRLITAIENSCFSLDGYSYLDRTNVNADGVRQATEALIVLLNEHSQLIPAVSAKHKSRTAL